MFPVITLTMNFGSRLRVLFVPDLEYRISYENEKQDQGNNVGQNLYFVTLFVALFVRRVRGALFNVKHPPP
ncbi:MAG: hypothetical protein ABI579_09215, partial [Candidatus Sumerlaeota bacterium]